MFLIQNYPLDLGCRSASAPALMQTRTLDILLVLQDVTCKRANLYSFCKILTMQSTCKPRYHCTRLTSNANAEEIRYCLGSPGASHLLSQKGQRLPLLAKQEERSSRVNHEKPVLFPCIKWAFLASTPSFFLSFQHPSPFLRKGGWEDS